MTKRILHIVCLVAFSCFFQISFSQSVYVSASVDKDKIVIGEPIHLRLELSLPVGTNAKWFALDSIPHFEFIEQGKIDTVSTRTLHTYNQVITITGFDSGRWIIPAIPLDLNGRSYLTDSIPVSVAFSNFDASQDYHDIKDILAVEKSSLNYINWVIAVITLLSLMALIYFLRKKKQKTGATVMRTTSKLSPYDEAVSLLQELKSRRLPENGQTKLYYSGLSDILRLFISRKLSLATMQKTSEEIILQVKDLGLSNDAFISMAQTLRMTDAVKFAKYIPGNEHNEESFKNIKASIELLNKLMT